MFSVFFPAVGLDTSQTEASWGLDDSPSVSAVVLENIPEHVNLDYLALLVDSCCNLSEDKYSLEFIPELNTAVMTFNEPSGMS